MASVVAELRGLAPRRAMSISEARLLAERQAARLLRLSGVTGPPVPEQVIECLPRVEVHYLERRGLSGTTKWAGGRWVILVNRNDVWGRQRFSLAHEFKHVLDWSKADGSTATATAPRTSKPSARPIASPLPC